MSDPQTTKRLSKSQHQRLLADALETTLNNIAVSGTRSEINKARWFIAQMEKCARFPGLEPIRKVSPWFEAWRKGSQPELKL